MLYLFCLNGLGQNTAHDEGTECGGEPHGRCYHHHAEAQSKSCDKHGLITHQRLHFAQEQRYEEDANHKPKDEEEYEFQDGHEHLRALELFADSQCREHHHEHNGQDVFDDEHAQYEAGKAFLP